MCDVVAVIVFTYLWQAHLRQSRLEKVTDLFMTAIRKASICALLKGIETGDPESVKVVNEARYIQHNPETHEGSEGLAALFKRLSTMSPRVNIVRIFSDGDYVFGHTEYDFGSPKVGFEVFRFEDDQAVEHWDNIQPRQGPNPSGRGMVDGPVEATGFEHTEVNRETVRAFVEAVLIERRLDRIEHYVDAQFIQHDPHIGDGPEALRAALSLPCGDTGGSRYDRSHRLLAEGNFVLSVSEGFLADAHTSFYDLFRLDGGRLVEHWNTIETIPPRSAWKNDNGKF